MKDKSYYAALSHAPSIIHRCLMDVAKAQLSGQGSQQAQIRLRDVMRKTMALADVLGRKRVIEESRAKAGPMQFSSRAMHHGYTSLVDARFGIKDILKQGWSSFGDAIDALLSREPILARSREAIAKAYALGQKFAVAKIPDSVSDMAAKKITQKVWEKTAELGSEGRSPDKARKILAEIGGFSQSYAETVYRTNLASAYTAGRFKEMEDPDVRAITPAFEFSAVNDVSTRHNHGAADGAIADSSDPIWDRLSPPLGFNCRCDLRVVHVFELRERGLIDKDGKVKRWLPATFKDAKADKGFTVTRPDRRMYS